MHAVPRSQKLATPMQRTMKLDSTYAKSLGVLSTISLLYVADKRNRSSQLRKADSRDQMRNTNWFFFIALCSSSFEKASVCVWLYINKISLWLFRFFFLFTLPKLLEVMLFHVVIWFSLCLEMQRMAGCADSLGCSKSTKGHCPVGRPETWCGGMALRAWWRGKKVESEKERLRRREGGVGGYAGGKKVKRIRSALRIAFFISIQTRH